MLTSDRTNNSAFKVNKGVVSSVKDENANQRAGRDVARKYVDSKMAPRAADQRFDGKRGAPQDFEYVLDHSLSFKTN